VLVVRLRVGDVAVHLRQVEVLRRREVLLRIGFGNSFIWNFFIWNFFIRNFFIRNFFIWNFFIRNFFIQNFFIRNFFIRNLFWKLFYYFFINGEPLWLSGKVIEWENKQNQKIPGSLVCPGNLFKNGTMAIPLTTFSLTDV
jgi:hypothetical protein